MPTSLPPEWSNKPVSKKMFSNSSPHQQHIREVWAKNSSQAFAGYARDIHFSASKRPQETFEEKVKACRNALFLTCPHVDRETLISTKGKRTHGTCEWIIQNESYRSCLGGNTHLLWISGGPGKRKAMLSMFLTEDIEKTTQVTKDTELLFYFCSHKHKERNTAVAVLRGLMYQIILKRPDMAKHALQSFESTAMAQATLSSLEALWIIFRNLVRGSSLGKTFCVLDGLDECVRGSVGILVSKISDLFLESLQLITHGFKLVVISRNIIGLRGCTHIKLDVDNDERVISDIKLFISVEVKEMSRETDGLNDEFLSHVQNDLLKRSESTFLWVGFVMNQLSQKKTCTEVSETLRDVPRGLLETYSRMLLQIESNRRRTSSLILNWVAMAIRPLTLQELAAAIDIKPSPWITREQAVRDYITMCGPILKVLGQEVGFVHQSARDYLLRKEPDGDEVLEGFRIKPEEAHWGLARTCVDCIAHRSLQYKPLDLDSPPCSQESPLLRYALLYWPEHARRYSTLKVELVDIWKQLFGNNSKLRDNWRETYLSINI